MSDAFRDAIADLVDTSCAQAALTTADAMLAMPEMQAIRQALHDYTIEYGFGGKSRQAEILHRRGMPESVIAWVLGHE